MSDKVRIGVVGTSWWADAMYLPALTAPPLADVRGVVGHGRRTLASSPTAGASQAPTIRSMRCSPRSRSTGTPASPDFRDGLAVQRVVDAASRSAREGRRVTTAEIVAGEG